MLYIIFWELVNTGIQGYGGPIHYNNEEDIKKVIYELNVKYNGKFTHWPEKYVSKI